MNKDLEVFENRSDDWLALERKYEQTISAWDLDEAKRIKIEHEDNCEANEIKRNHEIRHQTYNNDYKDVNDLLRPQVDQKKLLLIFVLCFTLIPIIIFVMILETNGNIGEFAFAMPIISLIIIVNILKKKERNK